jgi:hypothetical protein
MGRAEGGQAANSSESCSWISEADLCGNSSNRALRVSFNSVSVAVKLQEYMRESVGFLSSLISDLSCAGVSR